MIMDKIKLEEDVRRRRQEAYSCGETTLTSLGKHWNLDFTEETLRAMALPFRGGIGATFGDGTCGALSGAIMAIGIREKDDKKRSVALAKEVFTKFEEMFGTVCCGRMYQKGRSHCTNCCVAAALLADSAANQI